MVVTLIPRKSSTEINKIQIYHRNGLYVSFVNLRPGRLTTHQNMRTTCAFSSARVSKCNASNDMSWPTLFRNSDAMRVRHFKKTRLALGLFPNQVHLKGSYSIYGRAVLRAARPGFPSPGPAVPPTTHPPLPTPHSPPLAN